MEYLELDETTRLQVARNLLRSREEEHYKLSLMETPDKEDRLTEIEAQISTVRPEVKKLARAERQRQQAETVAPDPAPAEEAPAEEAPAEGQPTE